MSADNVRYVGESSSSTVVVGGISQRRSVCGHYQVCHVSTEVVADGEGCVCFDRIEVFRFGNNNVAFPFVGYSDGACDSRHVLPSLGYFDLDGG